MRCRVACTALALLAGLAAGAPSARGGPEAAARPVVHRLPFPSGTSYKVWQGNTQGPSHDDQWNRYAFDFSPMPVGSPVAATADGTVIYVKEDADGPTGDWHDNNEVAVLHADGTVGTYLHLEKDGALVQVGDTVFAGDVIGRSGNTGNSRAPHLHFGLRDKVRLGPSVPCRFADLPGGGVPRTGDVVTSGNVAGRPLHEALRAFEALYDDASALDAREALGTELAALERRPPPPVARALEALGRREDFVGIYRQARDRLLARHRAEAREALARLAAAIEEPVTPDVVYLATVGAREFEHVEGYRLFAAALKELRSQGGYDEAHEGARSRLTLRGRCVRALARDLKAREDEARGRRVSWKDVARLYEQAREDAEAGEGASCEEAAARLGRLEEEAAARVRR